MAFNLSLKENQLAVLAEEGVEFELRHPDTDEPLGAFVEVRGQRSTIVEKYIRKQINEQIRLENGNKARKDKAKTIEESIEDLNEAVFVRVKSWRGIEEDGQELECTKENILEVFKNHSWIRDQILEVSNDAERFLPK